MRYQHYFLMIVHSVFVIITCNAMENKRTSLKDIKTIKAIANPLRVCCLTDDRVVIGNNKGCFLVDVTRDRIIQQINRFNYSKSKNLLDLKVCQKRQKIVTYYDKTVEIYDGKTGKKEWSAFAEKPIKDIDFCSLNSTLFVCYGGTSCFGNDEKPDNKITRYNYTNKEESCRDLFLSNQNCVCVTVHPKEEKIFTVDTFGGACLYALKDAQVDEKKIVVPGGSNGIYDCFYSPDGSYIAVTNCLYVAFVDSNKESKKHPDFCFGDRYGLGVTIQLHPNSKALGLLYLTQERGKDKARLIYWDIEMQKEIGRSSFETKAYDFGFSPDGKFVVVAKENECAVLSVPEEVVYVGYHSIKKLLWCLFVLNQFQEKGYLVKDVRQKCANILLDQFQ